MAVGLEDSLPDGGVGISKEMLKQADEWLKSMLEIASVQKEADMIEHMKERIKVQKWLMEQAGRVQALEFYKQDWMLVTEQNKRYREELDILGEVINSAPNADKLNEEYERLKRLEESQ